MWLLRGAPEIDQVGLWDPAQPSPAIYYLYPDVPVGFYWPSGDRRHCSLAQCSDLDAIESRLAVHPDAQAPSAADLGQDGGRCGAWRRRVCGCWCVGRCGRERVCWAWRRRGGSRGCGLRSWCECRCVCRGWTGCQGRRGTWRGCSRWRGRYQGIQARREYD